MRGPHSHQGVTYVSIHIVQPSWPGETCKALIGQGYKPGASNFEVMSHMFPLIGDALTSWTHASSTEYTFAGLILCQDPATKTFQREFPSQDPSFPVLPLSFCPFSLVKECTFTNSIFKQQKALRNKWLKRAWCQQLRHVYDSMNSQHVPHDVKGGGLFVFIQ